MKITCKYVYPETGTRNGRVYSREVLEKAFNDPMFKEYNESKAIPVKFEDDDFIGLASAQLDGTTVTVDAEIVNTTYMEVLKTAPESIGFTLAGHGNTICKEEDGLNVVTDFTIDSVLISSRAAVDCQTEICMED